MKQLKTFARHFLLGNWKGEGSGQFPTISSFNYAATLIFNLSQNCH
ncbi:MAG: heme-binding beta-barrel domain-containing protein [Cyclobacteriaceae bacterium]